MRLLSGIVAALLLILAAVNTFLWIQSYTATKSFVLSDKAILFVERGEIWYTRDPRGGLRAVGPLVHGLRLSTAFTDGPNTWGFRYAEPPPFTIIIFPSWLILLPTILPAFILVAFLWNSRGRSYRYGFCPNCGYDIRASPKRCPECGTYVN